MKKLALAWVMMMAMTIGFALTQAHAQSVACGIRNKAFRAGERVQFNVFYTMGPFSANAGTVIFSVFQEALNGKPVYHVVGDGRTNPGYDWIYKVRDRYETFIDTSNLTPLKFIRNVDEGGYKIFESVNFHHDTHTAVTSSGAYKVPACVQDVLSEVYMARNLNFGAMKPGEQIPFDLFLDNKVYNMYVRYLGKEVVKTKYGKFRCIKFKPLLLKGSIFEGGEKMTVWVTDDANRLPVRIESPILVGSIKVDMMTYSNLRHPLTSLISLR